MLNVCALNSNNWRQACNQAQYFYQNIQGLRNIINILTFYVVSDWPINARNLIFQHNTTNIFENKFGEESSFVLLKSCFWKENAVTLSQNAMCTALTQSPVVKPRSTRHSKHGPNLLKMFVWLKNSNEKKEYISR